MVLTIEQLKIKREAKLYAKMHHVSLQEAITTVTRRIESETTTTVQITEEEALEALKGAIPTHVLLEEEEDELDKMARELGIDKITPIKWNPDIPY